MNDLTEAQALGIDVSDVVVVTHPDKLIPSGARRGKRREFQMPYLAYVKRGLEEQGYEIEGRAIETAQPKSYRELELEAEVERLRQQVAEAAVDDGVPDDDGAPARSREDLLAEAEELGIKVHPNTKDETIEARIAAVRAASVNASDEDFD